MIEVDAKPMPVFYPAAFYRDAEQMREVFGDIPWTEEQIAAAEAGDGILGVRSGVQFVITRKAPKINLAKVWTSAIAAGLATELRKRKTTLTEEARLHAAISVVLTRLNLKHAREFQLTPRDRLDFVVEGRIAIEVKKGNAGLNEMRQVGRYLEHEFVNGCIIICMRARGIPPTFNGKPIEVIELWRMVI